MMMIIINTNIISIVIRNIIITACAYVSTNQSSSLKLNTIINTNIIMTMH